VALGGEVDDAIDGPLVPEPPDLLLIADVPLDEDELLPIQQVG